MILLELLKIFKPIGYYDVLEYLKLYNAILCVSLNLFTLATG